MDDSFRKDLSELQDAHRELLGMVDAVEGTKTPKEQLTALRDLIARQRKVGELTKAARNRFEREYHALSERQRVDDLRGGAKAEPSAIALAILRGDFVAARHGLQHVAARSDGPVASDGVAASDAFAKSLDVLGKSLIRPLNALIEGGPHAIKHLESAMHRLRHGEERLSITRELRGALLVQLGRLYREELRSAHMAAGAFREAAGLIRTQPEPIAERAELLRRAGRLDLARDCFTEASRLGPHRAGAWIGLALIAEARGAVEDAKLFASRAAEIVISEDDPMVVLRRIQPSPCKTLLVELAGRAKEADNLGLATAAYDEVMRGRVPLDPTLPELLVNRARLTIPPDPEALVEAGRLQCWRGAYDLAITLLREATTLRPRSRIAFAYLADALRLAAVQLKDDERDKRTKYLLGALEASRAAIEYEGLGAGDAWTLITHARIVQTLVDDETRSDDDLWEALVNCEHALILEPRNAACLTRTARLHHAVGNPLTARHCAEAAVKEAPGDADAVSNLVWILSVSGDFDRAKDLMSGLPDSTWRRGADAYIRMRKYRGPEDDDSLEAAKALLALPAADWQMRSWQPFSMGLCMLLLRDTEGARSQFEAALASARPVDKVYAAVYLEEFRQAIEMGESQRGRLSYHTDENLIAALTIAHLAVGDIEHARQHFDRLCVFLRGPIAGNWAITFERDVGLLKTFRELPEPALSTWQSMIAKLRHLARQPERRHSPPTRELEASLRDASSKLTATELEALRLAYVRTALAEGLIDAALAELLHLPDTPRGRDARSRAASSALAAASDGKAASIDAILKLGPRPEWILERLTSSRQCAAVLSAVPDMWTSAPIVNWISNHLGLTAPKVDVGVPPVTLAIPDALPVEGNDEPHLVNVVIPSVRRAIEERYGTAFPGVTIRRLRHSNECRLFVRGRRVSKLASRPRAGDADASLETWMIDGLKDHVASLVGTSEVVAKIDQITEVSSIDHDARLISDTGALLRLWRLARGLLKEHVPLTPWRNVAHAARAGRGLPFEAMLNRARRYLNEGLCEEISRRMLISGGSAPVVEVPRRVASAVVANLGLDGIRAYFAATPDDTASLLFELGPKLGNAPMFRVVEPEARSWIQQLVQLERPGSMVISEDEYQRYHGWLERRARTP